MSSRTVEQPSFSGERLSRQVWRRLPFADIARRPLLLICLLVIAAYLVVAIYPGIVARYDPAALNTGPRFDAPSFDHLLGTDHFGRDVASRIAFGIRTSVMLSFGAVGLAVVVGGAIGIVSGFRGGWLDLFLQRVVDAVMALPSLVLAIVLVLALGRSQWGVLIAVAAILVPTSIRVARSAAMACRRQDFVLAAESVGVPWPRMFLRYVAPAAVPPLIIIATVELGTVIIIESSLSFLGYGAPPPTPTLGGILSDEGRRFMEQAPWLVYGPGAVLSILILAFNLAGDGARDLMDPRTRRL